MAVDIPAVFNEGWNAARDRWAADKSTSIPPGVNPYQADDVSAQVWRDGWKAWMVDPVVAARIDRESAAGDTNPPE